MTLEQDITLPSLLEKLKQNGYETLKEIKEASVYDLTQELQLNKEEVSYLIKISGKEARVKRTIAEIIAFERDYSISTGCKNFDKLLEYGIPPFKITEICGESGTGKSQLCMQLAVNVQLGKSQGGVQGDCIYIDTEGSFQSSRVVELAKDHDTERILKGITVFRVLDHKELIALIRQLPDILAEHKNVKLIVIDSIVYHFRLNSMDSRTRTSMLDYFAQSLIELANVNQLAVVVTNHVTMVDHTWTPSLGSSWGIWCANRLLLYRRKQFRYGYLYKSVENQDTKLVPFCIKNEGIVDPEEDELELEIPETEEEAEMTKAFESTWEEMKEQQIKEELEAEEEMFDNMWDETLDEGIMIQQQPVAAEPSIENIKEKSEALEEEKQKHDLIEERKRKHEEEAPLIEEKKQKMSIDNNAKSADIPAEEDNEWASDLEEELDWDFINNFSCYV